MKNVCIVTSTRAEYGLLKNTIKKLACYKDIKVNLLVTGTHLLEAHGMTYKEIENDGIEIAAKIDIMGELGDEIEPTAVTAEAVKLFGEFFKENKQDILIVLGDRYEMLGICFAAVLNNIPIAHLHGGEVTEGAIDEVVRHSITKMAFLHFTSTEEYRKRVIQLGEEPERVYNVGAPGVENALTLEKMSKDELISEINNLIGTNIKTDQKIALVTYHPVTTMPGQVEKHIKSLLEAMEHFREIYFIITKANADEGGNRINRMFEAYAESRDNVVLVSSLGMKRYLNGLRHAEFVLGNSSSGILEAPSFGLPTVNIGDRQKGRIRAKSVIDCDAESQAIVKAINKAMSDEFHKEIQGMTSPYGNGHTSDRIAEIIYDYLINDKLKTSKGFYDLKV